MNAKTKNTAQLEQTQSSALWNRDQRDYPLNVCVPQLVAMQAAITPDAVALTAGEHVLNYGELNRQANQLCHYLQSLGVCRTIPGYGSRATGWELWPYLTCGASVHLIVHLIDENTK